MTRIRGFHGRLGGAFFLLAAFFVTLPADTWAKNVVGGKPPEWLTRSGLVSDDGYAVLEWADKSGERPGLYLLNERRDGQDRNRYVEGGRIRIYRSVPGDYTFTLQECSPGSGQAPVCGRESARLTLSVSESARKQIPATQNAEFPSDSQDASGSTVGGPGQMRPGLWYNPERQGHGFSFYWANRLSLPESHELHGFAYDLLGVWYTYEAKASRYDWGAGWTLSDYQPLAMRFKLVQDGSNRFSGAAYVTRGGQEAEVGSVSVTFGSDNTVAQVEWSVDFKLEHLSGHDSLTLLAGSNPAETGGISHLAGIWVDAGASHFQVIEDIGSVSEAVDILFEDSSGDPTWVQAANSSSPVRDNTPLCFYYANSGYAPDRQGQISVSSLGCDYSATADSLNRNGSRYFPEFEQMRFWVSATLPNERGSIHIGNPGEPAVLNKVASFHRVYFAQAFSPCELVAGICTVELTWFTDGDYPDASLFSRNQETGQRVLLADSAGTVVTGHNINLNQQGRFVFELRMGSAPDSTLMAESSELRVVQAVVARPADLHAAWTNQSELKYRVEWSHPDPQSVERFELEETLPGSPQPDIHAVSPASTTARDFARPDGPFGEYRYRVRACSGGGALAVCSAWSDELPWLVADPGITPAGPVYPWAHLSSSAGTLIKNIAMDYAMGYHFRPETDGHVHELGGLFNGIKTVRLFRRETGELLAEAQVASSNGWRYTPVPEVALQAGEEYTVAVYLAGSGGNYFNGPTFPVSHGGIEVLSSTYSYTGSNPDAIPINSVTHSMYGQADIGFVEAAPDKPGPDPEPEPEPGDANPDTPPRPASRPSFGIDAGSVSAGAIGGEFFVDAQGVANYRIPMLTAPGSGGLVPAVSLHYRSQGANDVAGVGWAIGGQSAITRCPATREHDGIAGRHGVSLDHSDRFCLDGQRLLAVNGEYGKGGTEYRLEIDDFSRIVSVGQVGNGPVRFEHWHGDGSVSHYGNSTDSRVEARVPGDGSTVMTWAINRRQDGSGNYIDYVYDERETGPVEVTLSAVRYTGNSRVGTLPYAEIRFSYENGRTDIPDSRILGNSVSHRKLLKRVDSLAKVRAGDSEMRSLRSWFLEYGQDGHGRKILVSVEACNDALRSYCHMPTRFDWLKFENAISQTGNTVGELFPSNFKGLGLADVNGDGRTDLLIIKGNQSFSFNVAFAKADGTFQPANDEYPVPAAGSAKRAVRLLTIDLNGDGRQDIIYPKQDGTAVNWLARLSNSSGFGPETVVAGGCCGLVEPRVASVMDFNGDGLADVMTHSDTEGTVGQGGLVVLINGSRPGGPPEFESPRPVALELSPELFPEDSNSGWLLELSALGFTEIADRTPAGVQPFDYNGDGNVDLLARIYRRYVRCVTNCSNAAAVPGSVVVSQEMSFDHSASWSSSSGADGYAVAFFVVLESDGEGRYLQREVVARDAETGCDVPVACGPWSGLPEVTRMLPVDINGDGLADLAYQDEGNQWFYRVNTGSGFAAPIPIGLVPDGATGGHARFVDLSGDGFPEFIYPSDLSSRTATWKVHANDLGSGFGAVELPGIRFGKQTEGDTSILADFNGDGAVDNLFIKIRDGKVRQRGTKLFAGVNLATGRSHEAVNAVSVAEDGFGKRIEIEYGVLTDPAVHTRLDNATKAEWGRGSAVFDLAVPAYAVRNVAQSAPVYGDDSSMFLTEYHYVGAKIQAGGRGFLGFSEVVQWSPDSGLRTNTRYRQDFPFTGLPADTLEAVAEHNDRHRALSALKSRELPDWPEVTAATRPAAGEIGGAVIAYSASDWQSSGAGGVHSRQQKARLELAWSPGGDPIKKSYTRNHYAEFGRLVESVEQSWDTERGVVALTVTTRSTYHPVDNAAWNLNRVSEISVHHQRPGVTSVTRSSAFEYDAVSGRLVREITEPSDSDFRVVSDYRLDGFGNRTQTTVRAANVPARSSRLEFDGLGRFAVAEYNHFNQQVMRIHDWNSSGTPLKVSDIDGVVTESFADPMGRVFANWTETGAWQKTVHGPGAGSVCPAGTSIHSHTHTAGKPDAYSCLDRLQRETRTAIAGFNGGWIYTDTSYDSLGRPERVSEPYFAGGTRYWNTTAYDAVGRLVAIDAADGNDISMRYGNDGSGFCGVRSFYATETLNGLGQKQVEVHNALGETVAVFDDLCGTVVNRFDAVGNLLEVTGPSGSRLTMTYDQAGRRTSMNDPDKGFWQYAWNGLGEMLRQLDAKGQAMDYEYDGQGRVLLRRELSGVDDIGDAIYTVENVEETEWQNSTTATTRGKGQPVRIAYRKGLLDEVLHRQDFSYDGFGRVSRVRSTIDGLQFTEQTTYDEYGRKFQEFDASGDFRGLRYRYNAHGYLDQIAESREGADAVVYRDVEGMDARGNFTYAVLGNGVEVFATHNPASGQLEKLEAYDALGQELQDANYVFDELGNLLQREDRSDGRDLTEDFSYDTLNRLTRVRLTAPANGLPSPTDTLALEYDASGNITRKSDVGHYHYGAGQAGPHAVTWAGGRSYAYDANGNQVSGDGRTIQYSVFDKPVRIEKAGQFTSFEYGIAHRRVARIDGNEADGDKTTIYIGGVEYTDDGVKTYFKRYLAGVATVTFFPATRRSDSLYAVKDHLGSIHNLTDESGQAGNAVWMSFDAFGQRRASNWSNGLGVPDTKFLNGLTNRGFTGHEHVDSMGLIHMNGRTYDPALGRFLQADPLIQAPGNTQALNRYSYALNNPLSLTDPSGYFLKRLVSRWGRLAAALALSVVLPGGQGILATVFHVGNAYAQAAITGFIAGAITSGTLKGAVIGAFTALAIAGIVEAHSAAEIGEGMAELKDVVPKESTLQHLHGNNGETQGLFRIFTKDDGSLIELKRITSKGVVNGDTIFTNGMKNNFSDAVRNGTTHLHQKGLLSDSYILNFNPTKGFAADFFEASQDIIGAHLGWTQSGLARNLAGLLDQISGNGISGIQLVGHSQGGAITASALRYAVKVELNLSALSSGGVSLHGAPVNAWMARQRLGNRIGVDIVSHHQFGDAVHVLGGLNLKNPLEVPISLLRAPSLFSGDPSLNPHSMPCGNGTAFICGN